MRTLAPSSDSSSAVARPMPRAEPVTMATCPSRTPMCASSEDQGAVRRGNSKPMRLYPDLPALRARTIAADAAIVVLVLLFAWLGFKVHDAVDELAGLGRGVSDAGRSVQGGFSTAGNAVGG